MGLFKKAFGINYFDDLHRKREEKRKELIEEAEQTIAEYEKYANQGDFEYQTRIINLYSDGLLDEFGEPTLFKDLTKAHEWVKKAASSGNTGQQIRLCSDYFNGKGCQQDVNKAIQLYEECASRQLPVYSELGLIFSMGNESPMNHYPPQNFAKAFKWYKMSVDEIGDNESKYELGVSYLEGKGVSKNISKARALFEEVMQDTGGWYYCLARDKLIECS